jgi:DNA polymerase-3 subunit epsilon
MLSMEELLDRPLSRAPLVVLDTETTGLSPAMGHRVVEVAAVRLQGWREVGQFSALVNPGRSMDPGASRVNGIYDEDLVDAPPFADIAPSLHTLLQDAILVAHNARFDAAFLGMEFTLLQDAAPREPVRWGLPNPWLCTLQLSRKLFFFRRNNLTEVARSLGVHVKRTHRALSDVYTTVGVLTKMTKQLQARHLHTVGDLLRAQGGPIYVPRHAHLPLPQRLAGPLAKALATHCSLRIRYRSPHGETDRVISPLYATEQGGAGYVVAFCHLRQAQRTFRIDRIIQARVLD